MQKQLDKLIQDIKDSYAGRRAGEWTDTKKKVYADMTKDFNDNLEVKQGNKYLKIVSKQYGVWGFIVNTDKDKKFNKGDILKAAGYNAPARNQARGNILTGYNPTTQLFWTGPAYLR
ncbi:uncharacterized protein METZ01_LOCUS375677 [marine metagenome]|uniref:Uncharacterized protein n=1 Tax=marine metagenome TaxID=408172 RepID=A0A382TLI8_9ZZZZ